MVEPITIDEILAELSRCQPDNDSGGFTVAEICDHTGKSIGAVRKSVLQAIRSGTMECIRVKRLGMDGSVRPVPGYRLCHAKRVTGKKK
jgi:hypothetical protein